MNAKCNLSRLRHEAPIQQQVIIYKSGWKKWIQNETEFLSTLNIQRSNTDRDVTQAALVALVILRLFWGGEDCIFVA